MKTFAARSGWIGEGDLRLDAATYASGGLEARDRIRSGSWEWRRLDHVSQVYNEARFARTYVRDSARGTAYITASDMLLADLKGLLYLSRKSTPQMNRLLMEAGWTLISCSGTIGRTAYVRGDMVGLAGSHDIIRCVPDVSRVQPGFLFAFLSSTAAQAMIQQKTYGNVIQHIEPQHIADMPVPLPDAKEQERIHKLVAGAAAARTEASRLLDEASAYFDGLAGPMPSSHDHARAAGIVRRSHLDMRLDAFHHVGWAAEGATLSGEKIGFLGSVARPGTAKRIYVQRGIPFVSGIDVYQVRVSSRQRIMPSAAEAAGSLIHAGQILVQRGGQRYGLLGRPAYVGQRMDGWAASEDLMSITLHEPASVARVFAYLRSDIGHRTLLRSSFGTSIPKLNPEGLSHVEVPSLPAYLLAGASKAIELREQADADEERAIWEVERWVG